MAVTGHAPLLPQTAVPGLGEMNTTSHTHTHIHTHRQTHIHTHNHTCTYTHTHTHTHTDTHTHTHTHRHTYTHTYIRALSLSYYTCTEKYIHVHVYTCIYMSAQNTCVYMLYVGFRDLCECDFKAWALASECSESVEPLKSPRIFMSRFVCRIGQMLFIS